MVTGAVVYADGTTHAQRAGRAACGWSVMDVAHGTEATCGGKYLYACDAMEAELHGVIEGLRAARRHGYRQITVRSDSNHVIRCLDDITAAGATLRYLVQRAHEASTDARLSFEHIPRRRNRRAHVLARQALAAHEEAAEDGALSATDRAAAAQHLSALRKEVLRAVPAASRRIENGGPDEIADALGIIRGLDQTLRQRLDAIYARVTLPGE